MNYHRDPQRISAEIKRLFELPTDVPLDLQASVARYACVLTSSYLEASLRAEFLKYASTKVNDRHVMAFVKSSLDRLRNPSTKHILDLIGRFGGDLREALSDKLDDRHRVSINSVNAHRNAIVHGRTSTISLAYVKQYYADSEVVVKKIRDVLYQSEALKAEM